MNIIKKYFVFSLLFFLLSSVFPRVTFAQTPPPKAPQLPVESYMKAKVLAIPTQGEKTIDGNNYPYQQLNLQILDGAEKGKTMTLLYGDMTTIRENQKVTQGQTVVLMKSVTPQKTLYQIVDIYRLDRLYPLAILFFVVVVLITRLQGLGAIIGLGISLTIIIAFIVPQILAGQDPLLASIVGSLFIMVATMYLAHGFSQKTNIALIATSISLILTGLLAYAAVHLTFLTGMGSDDAATLQYGPTSTINLQGLLLGGIIIGSLGVLEDITTGLAAALQELVRVNRKLGFAELVRSGLRIGSEHIAALVNTLVLAYAGVGLPLFLFIVINPHQQPLWYIINSEIIMEEIVRTLAGSIGLILSVPLTAIFAAWAFQQKNR
jgi:uncharacterized membrane protein